MSEYLPLKLGNRDPKKTLRIFTPEASKYGGKHERVSTPEARLVEYLPLKLHDGGISTPEPRKQRPEEYIFP